MSPLTHKYISIGFAAVALAAAAHADVNGFNGGTGWSLNGAPVPIASGNTLDMGQNQFGGASSAFFNTAQSITQFDASFGFRLTGGLGSDGGPDNSPGDGFTFMMQSSTPVAVGGAGGGLGFTQVSNATGVAYDFWVAGGPGTGIANSSIPYNYTSVSPVDLRSTDQMWTNLRYSGGMLSETITDMTNGATFHQDVAVDFAALSGNPWAWVGFSDGTGGAVHDVVISDFKFTHSVPDGGSVAVLMTIALGGVAAMRRRFAR